MILKVGIFIAAAVLIVLMLPREGTYKYEYQRGKPWVYGDLIAPVNFPIYKSDEMIQADRKIVMDNRKLYFVNDTLVIPKGRSEIEKSFGQLWPAINKQEVKQDSLHYLNLTLLVYNDIMKRGVIEDVPELTGLPENAIIVVLTGNRASNTNLSSYYAPLQAYDMVDAWIDSTMIFEYRFLSPLIKSIITPNILYNKDLTDKTLEQQLSNISLTNGVVQKGELVIGRGELVTDQKDRILESYQRSYAEQITVGGSQIWKIIGQALTAILSLLILALYLYLFKKEVFWNNKNIALVLLIILLMLAAMSITVKFGDEYIYALPICLVPLLVTTFFGARTAIFAHIAMLLNAGFIVVNGFEFMFIQLLAGIITIFSVLRLHKRVQVLKMILLVFPTYAVAHIGFILIKTGEPDFSGLLTSMTYFAFSAGFLIISYPLTYVFERLFGLVTDITLIEISDTNSKLLRELSEKAPGTFQHSNQVANLAEEAAYAINANPMLTRAGAWYHDIGKIENSQYFIENQMNKENPHDKLSYAESAKIITGHVTKGMEIAKKYHLPRQVADFINMHHGNRKATYFYRLAQQSGEPVDDAVFSYPGYLPDNKETALVMMADSVEAASKSLKEPNENNISQLVDKIIDDLVAEHQFDKVDITMRDISKVKQLFKKRLMNIYHVRIEYPEEKK